MVDKVKPLKIDDDNESIPIPTEFSVLDDYVAAKGVSLEGSDNTLIDLDGSQNIQFKDATQTTYVSVTQLKTAADNTFDNSSNGFTATDVQAAIEEAAAGSSGWGLTGNAGTTAGTNFIGTTDAVDFVVKTNGNELGRFGSSGLFTLKTNQEIQIQSAGDVGLTVKGKGGQTGNLQDWKNSAGTVLSYMNKTGQLSLGVTTGTPTTALAVGPKSATLTTEPGGESVGTQGINVYTQQSHKYAVGIWNNFDFGNGLLIKAGNGGENGNILDVRDRVNSQILLATPSGVTMSRYIKHGSLLTLLDDGTEAVTSYGINSNVNSGNKYGVGFQNRSDSGNGLLIQAGHPSVGTAYPLVVQSRLKDDVFVTTATALCGINVRPTVAHLEIKSKLSTNIGLLVKGHASQSAKLASFRDSSDTVMASVDKSGNIQTDIAGAGFKVKEGTNARMGTATLVAGTVTVSNTSVTANTRIFITVTTAGGTQGFLSTTRVASTSFTINSTSGTDTSAVNWLLIEPA